ncbi:phospholipid-transporting ATPase ABCA1 isoform X2 [Hydra vulgaris]|uniref:Phospholipid-transporting ATPase ABCA1 isoform X2 n=1 Tax=Hydra vulgaris TaxID=6087 RepID=A0ABM4BCN7_HYDVU
MAFLHQLKLLLWKNYTLKKRTPFILCIELIVPLILFLILVTIRIHRQPIQSKGDSWYPNALPSAGIVALLQSLCKGGDIIGSNGYKYYPNASINQILSDIVDVSKTPVLKALIDFKELEEDFTQLNLVNFSNKIDDVRFQNMFSSKDSLQSFFLKNLSMPSNIFDALMDTKLNSSKIFKFLKDNSMLVHLFVNNHTTVSDIQNEFQNQDTFAKMGEINSFYESTFLSDEIKSSVCSTEFLDWFSDEKVRQDNSLQKFLCNMTKEQVFELSKQMKLSFNYSKLFEMLNISRLLQSEYTEKAEKIRTGLFKMSKLEDAFKTLSKLAKDMKLNLTNIERRVNSSRSHKAKQNMNDLWAVLSPLICGTPPELSSDEHHNHRSHDSFSDLLSGSGESTRALKVMLYMMTNDPMILYSPNGTDADKVISKSAYILNTMKSSKDLANKWLSMSSGFQSFLYKNQTQMFLKDLLKLVDNFSNLNRSIFQDYDDIFNISSELQNYLVSNNEYSQFNFSKEALKQVINSFIVSNHQTNLVLKQMRLIDYMAKGWVAIFDPMKLDLFSGFPNETLMMEYISNITSNNKARKPILSAIVFDNINPDGSLPKHVVYRIRMNSLTLPSTQKIRTPYWVPGPQSSQSSYFHYGFAWLQDQLERAIIEVQTNQSVVAPGLYVEEIPYPCYLDDNFMFVLQYIMPLCVVVSFIYTVAILTQSIVYEKEHRLKEVMKMMGLSNTVHWTAWFITSVTIMMCIVILMTVVLKFGGILKYSNTAIVFLFLTLAALATTNFCFLMSIFFSKAKIAAACGGIIYFVTYMPYVFISVQEGGSHPQKIDAGYKSLASLFSTTALGLGSRYFALFEQNGVGVQWDNIGSSPAEDDTFNLFQVISMFVVDIFLYAILAWYIEAVHPGTYGIPRPWYFPFQLSYWLGPNFKTDCSLLKCFDTYKRVHSTLNVYPNTPALLAMEQEPSHLKLGVVIDSLFKTYGKGLPPAVDHLSLNLYEGQITSFLGHNGAGKTTTMSLLTGLFPPTSGTALIYGNDIHTDMDKIRTSLGMCPQHNVLYDKLTVEEHLWFYARLKGMREEDVQEETNQILKDISMPEKRNSKVNTLSGGMKRKLSVAIAFVGGSRTVILDEPTAGVDPYARRAIWELLEKYKSDRTILLSTHFMDEADILGDRIAIISHGKLRCCGSSLFLKTKFGDGYHLTLVKEEKKSSILSDECDVLVNNNVTELTSFIKKSIPTAQLLCETPYEISYILPDKGKDKKGKLRNLIERLEDNKELLGCSSFGLHDTTLEEVFLKVTEANIQGEQDNELTTNVNSYHPSSPTSTSSRDFMLIEKLGSEVDELPLLQNHAQGVIQRSKHIRSLSSDSSSISSPKLVSNCAHRRTPSGNYCGHRRAVSNDLSFALHSGNIQDPRAVLQKIRQKECNRSTKKTELWKHHASGSRVVSKSFHLWQQFYALLLKRLHHTRRNIQGLLTHILLPGLFVSIAMSVALAQPKGDSYPPLVLSSAMFHPPPFYIPFTNNRNGDLALSFRLENTLKLPSGFGADCVLNGQVVPHSMSIKYLQRNVKKYFDKYCSDKISPNFQNIKKPYFPTYGKPACHCKIPEWIFECDKGIEGKPEAFTSVAQDTFLNITNEDFKTYLLNTNYLFKRRRYGALGFGDLQNTITKKLEESEYTDIQKLYVRQTARVWFSNKGFHAMPAFINAMNNAILRAYVTPKMGDPAAYGITAITHPLNTTQNVLNLDSIKQGTDAIIALFVIIAMSFVPASFVVFLVMERTTQSKHIQYVSGLHPLLYWLSNYLWDILTFLIPAGACMIIFYIFNVPAYASRTNFPAVCALFMCYGWSITPMMYPASFLFREASTAYVVLIVVNLFLGITCLVTTSILQLFPNDHQLAFVLEVVKVIFLVFPNYCLGRGLMDLAYNELMNMVNAQIGQFEKIHSPFEWQIVTRSLVYMFSEGVIFFIFTLFIEYKCMKRRPSNSKDGSSQKLDQDVASEKYRVLSGGADNDLLRVENLAKIYNSNQGKLLAVNNLYFGVAKGECFGLLGVNGAGKSTTFKMLTGDTSITSGDAFVENYSVVRNLLNVHSKIGYCPQFDALFDHLTAEEHLYFYARLKGIPELEIKNVCDWLIKKMALSRFANQRSKIYSGGNKRKLSTAIALIGNPSLVFMDEPTTGMDPGARRFLWNIILSIIEEGTRSVVLTSHSMEECEALCTRLAIMVNGQFQCIGSTQHIKNRFGDGYIIVIRVKGSPSNMLPVKKFMEENFFNCVMKETHHNVAQYQVPSTSNVSLSNIFKNLEDVCEQLLIEDYSVSQTSLDNVFVSFAKYQKDAVTQVNGSPLKAPKSALKTIKSNWRKAKVALGRSRSAKFERFVQLPMEEELGNIGENEDEIILSTADDVALLSNSGRLSFEVA